MNYKDEIIEYRMVKGDSCLGFGFQNGKQLTDIEYSDYIQHTKELFEYYEKYRDMINELKEKYNE